MTSLTDRILAFRTALPSHDLALGKNALRQWAITVCDAEIRWAARDFHKVSHDMGVNLAFDRNVDQAAAQPVRLPHEQAAGRVLNWASHLQAHEKEARGPWGRWAVMNEKERLAWRIRWVMLARGFVAAVKVYKAERGALQ
jgi:hypothetical protein